MIDGIPVNAFVLPAVEPRLGEFDIGGVLYHANYFHIYEEAREAMLRQIGVPYSALVNGGMHLVVVETHQEFRSPVRYGIPFTVTSWIELLRRSTVTIQYRFVDAAQKQIHSAWTKHVAVQQSGETFDAARFPDELKRGFEGFTATKS